MELGVWSCRRGGNCDGLQLAFLFPWPAQLLFSPREYLLVLEARKRKLEEKVSVIH